MDKVPVRVELELRIDVPQAMLAQEDRLLEYVQQWFRRNQEVPIGMILDHCIIRDVTQLEPWDLAADAHVGEWNPGDNW